LEDVIIIGAGVAGAACARELSRYQLSVRVIEAGSDVASGATRANSGIVHGGYDPAPGTLKARYNVAGSRLYPQLARELGFSYRGNGSLVVAFSDEERPMLQTLLERGRANGVEGLTIIEAEELHTREPNLSPAAVAALWVPTGAITNPYGVCLAFLENAVENGVIFERETRVEGIAREGEAWTLQTTSGPRHARIVINAAGIHSGELNDLVSAHEVHLTPRAGEYVLLDTEFGDTFTSTMFQTPTAAGKGVLVTPTTGGNLLIGPDAVQRDRADQTETTPEGLDHVLADAAKTWEHIAWRGIITNFAGLRSSCLDDPDFILGEPDDAPGFFNICAFDSPGLTAAPAVALEYARTIAERLGAAEKPDFDPVRRCAAPSFRKATDDQRRELIARDPRYGRIVCRCECVSEGEIVAAIHSPVPATTTDAIKWRTRAGMGRCQAGFCLPVVAEILARETGRDIADICKSTTAAHLAVGHRGCLTDLPTVTGVEEVRHDA